MSIILTQKILWLSFDPNFGREQQKFMMLATLETLWILLT
jgi:hypothetical protein